MLKLICLILIFSQDPVVQEPQLSDSARKYAERLADAKQKQIDQAEEEITKLRKSKASKQSIAEAKSKLEKINAKKEFDVPSFNFQFMRPGYIGKFTSLEAAGERDYTVPSRFRVIEILDDTSAIVSLKGSAMIFKGIQTKNLTTETLQQFPYVFECKKTETYKTAGAGDATVWVFEIFTEQDAAVAYAEKLLKKKK